MLNETEALFISHFANTVFCLKCVNGLILRNVNDIISTNDAGMRGSRRNENLTWAIHPHIFLAGQ